MRTIDISGPIYEGMWDYGGDIKGYTANDVPIEKLFMVDSYVLQMPYEGLRIIDDRPSIFMDDMKKAEKDDIPEGSGIIMSTGYGKN